MFCAPIEVLHEKFKKLYVQPNTLIWNTKGLKRYILIDAGANPELFAKYKSQIIEKHSAQALFKHTIDFASEDYGPWLIEVTSSILWQEEWFKIFYRQNIEKPCLAFLTVYETKASTLLKTLSQLLGFQTSKGQDGILRYYDQRVFPTFLQIVKNNQHFNNLIEHVHSFNFLIPKSKLFQCYFFHNELKKLRNDST